MIVLDAAAAIELILTTPTGAVVSRRLRGESVHVPFHFDVETMGAIRHQLLRGTLSEHDAHAAVVTLRRLRLRRRSIRSGLDRAWALRHSLTVADALYVALAEALNAPLLTCDERLARSHGHQAVIELP